MSVATADLKRNRRPLDELRLQARIDRVVVRLGTLACSSRRCIIGGPVGHG